MLLFFFYPDFSVLANGTEQVFLFVSVIVTLDCFMWSSLWTHFVNLRSFFLNIYLFHLWAAL